MKILITGANSYIGMSFERYVSAFEEFNITTIDMIDGSWKEKDFSDFDAVFHVAGIAHSHSGKLSEERKKLYYAVNSDLAEAVAKKAKVDGVGQFVYMSSAIVFGDSAKIGQQKKITRDTPLCPTNAYGDSKLQAEKKLLPLGDDHFKIVIVRPPMVYGKNSKGNYPILSKYAKKLPIFPNVNNERSMIYIESLCEFIRLMIKNREQGIFMPQNLEYVKTSDMVRLIAKLDGHKIVLTTGFTPMLKVFSPTMHIINKAFGNLTYDKSLSVYKESYQVCDFEESIRRTEQP